MKISKKFPIYLDIRKVFIVTLCSIVAGLIVISPVIKTPEINQKIEQSLFDPTSIQTEKTSETQKQRISEQYGNLPLSFEANQGQTDSQVKFLSRGSGYTLFLMPTEAVLSLSKPSPQKKDKFNPAEITELPTQTEKSEADVVRMKLIGANPSPEIKGLGELSGKSNYFIGNDPNKWITNVTQYAKVIYENVYQGVDVVYYGKQRQLEYDFIVKPNIDPDQIRLKFQGAEQLRIDETGDLVLSIDGGEIRQHKPVIYQEINGERREVAGSYSLKGNQEVGFKIESYEANQPLIIDPVIIYSTYLGGSQIPGDDVAIGLDIGLGVAVDSAGNAYVTGYTASPNFPTMNAIDTSFGGPRDVFVTKLTSTGALSYSTYISGSNIFAEERGHGIAVDSIGNAYITGATQSSDFPVLNAYQSSLNGGADAFVTKLTSTGLLSYSTFLGGSVYEQGYSITVDQSGNAYVAGYSVSPDFPTLNAYQISNSGGHDIFVTKLDANGDLNYSTYLGGSDYDVSFGIAIDSSENIYITGSTLSLDFPITPNAFQNGYDSSAGIGDSYVTKLNPSEGLIYSTYLGGNDYDYGLSIAVDIVGNAYLTGETRSRDFPTLNAYDNSFNGGAIDAFVAKFTTSGNLAYSTYLGGTGNNFCHDIAVDSVGNAYVTGSTESTNFPRLNAFTTLSSGGFLTKLTPIGGLSLSSLVGPAQYESIAIDSADNIYLVGYTTSSNYPTVNAFDSTYNGGYDAVVTKISLNSPPTISGQNITRQGGDSGTVSTIAFVNDDMTAASSLTVTLGTIPSGITISNVTNNNGTISAMVAADCAATSGNNIVPLRVTDGGGLTADTSLVVNVLSNTPPSLGNYPSAGVINIGASTTITPDAPPNDNVVVSNISVNSTGFAGAMSVNAATGTVTVNNASPVGSYTITVTATDNCGATTTRNFGLEVVKINQTITSFEPVGSKIFGDAPVTLNATASSGLPVSFQIVSGPGIISGNILTITGTGSIVVNATQSGDSSYNAAPEVTQTITVAKAASVVTAAAPAFIANGTSIALSGVLTGTANAPLGGQSITLSIGSGGGAQSCTTTTIADGSASCTISTVNQPLGPNLPVTSGFGGDSNYLASSGSSTTLVFAYAVGGGGAFVIGDGNAAVGQSVTFWGSKWSKDNSLSGGATPNSFKGFANRSSTNPASCGAIWTTDPGNSSNPPATVPEYMGVIVSSLITKSGSIISGNTTKVVVVQTNTDYDSSPGKAGTGTVIGVLCQ